MHVYTVNARRCRLQKVALVFGLGRELIRVPTSRQKVAGRLLKSKSTSFTTYLHPRENAQNVRVIQHD